MSLTTFRVQDVVIWRGAVGHRAELPQLMEMKKWTQKNLKQLSCLVWCSKWAAHTKHKKESKIFRWNSIFLFPNYINTGIVIQMTYMLGWACEHVTMYSVVEWGQWGPGQGISRYWWMSPRRWHGVIIAHQGPQWILSPIDTASINTNIIFIVHTYSI